MITVNSIGGGTLSAAVVAEKAQGTQAISPAQAHGDADLSASVAAYLSLPGFNASSAVDTGNDVSADAGTDDGSSQAAALQAVSDSDDDGLKQALKEFDDGLKSLSQRPETQAFQAKFGGDAQEDTLPRALPVPGVDEHGLLRLPGGDSLSADANHDGKVSEEELRRYQEPLTYRAEASQGLDALADGPSAFSLVEANRAYGVVSAAAAAA